EGLAMTEKFKKLIVLSRKDIVGKIVRRRRRNVFFSPKIVKNSLEVLKVLKNSLKVLNVLKNSLEVLKVLQMELQENSSIDEFGGSFEKKCLKKKSSGFVKKGNHDQDYDSSDDEGNTYFREALLVVGNDEFTELVMDSCGSYHMTHRKDFLYNFKVVNVVLFGYMIIGHALSKGRGKCKWVESGDERLSGYDDWDQEKKCVYTLEAKVMTFVVQKHRGSKQVGFKQPSSKQVWFKQLGHKQVEFKQLGPDVKTGVHGVKVEKRVWFEVELQGAQGNHKAGVFQVSNDDATVAQRRVPGQQGVEGNVAEKKKVKKVKESTKANLGKVL
nr:zinc finger, CCHC-type [Tanacetum cinerariifolium]